MVTVCRRGNDTMLGESSDPLQIFMVDDCQDTQLSFAVSKAKVGTPPYLQNMFVIALTLLSAMGDYSQPDMLINLISIQNFKTSYLGSPFVRFWWDFNQFSGKRLLFL